LNNSVFGRNWRSTYEEEIFMGGDGYIKYARSDGSFWSFGINDVGRTDHLLNRGSWVFAAPSSEMAFLNTQDSRMWILTFGNGEIRQFDPAIGGKLVAIFDRNKNETGIAYDNYGRLSGVGNASGNLFFNYGGTNPFLVTSVTSDFGISLTYTYNTQGQLTQVTEPDSSTINFAYNTQNLITSVTDMNGKVLESHTYDSQSRGLTSVRALGVGAVTLTYPNP
jgi:YD repeat-containing protein